MKIQEAYDFVLSKVERLKNEGIEFTINESIKTELLLDKYNKPDRLPSDKWINISFSLKDNNDLNKINDMEYLCKMVGITFDTRFGKTHRDWELDWSLKC